MNEDIITVELSRRQLDLITEALNAYEYPDDDGELFELLFLLDDE